MYSNNHLCKKKNLPGEANLAGLMPEACITVLWCTLTFAEFDDTALAALLQWITPGRKQKFERNPLAQWTSIFQS